VRLSKARVELPLPAFGGATPGTGDEASGAPVEIVSIDEIVLNDVEIVSGSRTLHGDIEASIEGPGLVLRSIDLRADDTSITATGQITDLSAPAGELTIKAGALNLDKLLGFATDFAGGTGTGGAIVHRAARNRRSAMNIAVTLEAPNASMGGLTLAKLAGRARLTPDSIVVDPVSFGLFGGRYEGRCRQMSPAARRRSAGTCCRTSTSPQPRHRGTPGVVTGRLSGRST
jgi:hypothetical protein